MLLGQSSSYIDKLCSSTTVLETGSGDCKAKATGNLTNFEQNILSIDLCKQFKKKDLSPNHDFVVISNDKMHMVIMLWKTELHGMMTFGAAPCIESIAPLYWTHRFMKKM